MAHTFNRYCLKHGHDWIETMEWYEDAYHIKHYKCSICGATQTRIDN